jgi:hypothetical protein
MTEPRIVTPEEAQAWIDSGNMHADLADRLAHTVATEHERRDAYARAAVVKALETLGHKMNVEGNYVTASVIFGEADEYKNGAPL